MEAPTAEICREFQARVDLVVTDSRTPGKELCYRVLCDADETEWKKSPQGTLNMSHKYAEHDIRHLQCVAHGSQQLSPEILQRIVRTVAEDSKK